MTYAELIALLPGWIGRPNDADITAKAPTFVALAEAKLNRRIKCRRNKARTTITPSSETLAVPSDFAGIATMRLSDDPQTVIEVVSNDRMAVLADADASGNIAAVTLEGENFVFWPVPSTATSVVLVYYQRIPGLQDAGTNWISDDHPDLYLYAMALEASIYLADSEQVEIYSSLLTTLIDDLNTSYVSEAPDRLTPTATVV